MEDAIQVLAAILALPSAREECSELTAKRGAPRRLYFSILQSVQCRLQCILGVWIFKGQSNLSRSVEMRASLEGNDSDLKQMLENMGLLSRIFCDSAFKSIGYSLAGTRKGSLGFKLGTNYVTMCHGQKLEYIEYMSTYIEGWS